MEIPENLHEGDNSQARRAGLLPPLGQLIFFEGGGGGGAFVELSVLLLHRHGAIIWFVFGVA